MRLWSTDPAVGLPAANLWRTRTPDSVIGDKLRSFRLTIDIQNSPMSAVAQYLQEISSLKVVASPGIADALITLKIQDLSLDHAIELLTLPYGWDARIEDGTVVIFDPKP
jgi:type II secretory pathway component HofQ